MRIKEVLMFSMFDNRLAIALADNSVLFTSPDLEAPLVIPAYGVRQAGTTSVLAVGDEAKVMHGKTPGSLEPATALKHGVISDFELAEALVRQGTQKTRRHNIVGPRVVFASRADSDVEKRAVKDAAIHAGAREAFLLDIGMASAMGLGLPVHEPKIQGVLLLDYDWYQFTVISLAGIICQTSGVQGIEQMADDARYHIRLTRNHLPDQQSFLAQFQQLGVNPAGAFEATGWEAWLGRAELGREKTERISPDLLAVGVMPVVIRITEDLKACLQKMPREQVSELGRSGVHLCGVGSRVPGLAALLSKHAGLPVVARSENPHPAILGARRILNELSSLKRVAMGGKK